MVKNVCLLYVRHFLTDFQFQEAYIAIFLAKIIGSQRTKVKLYALTCPEDIMRQRVLERTRSLPPGALVIDENAFELFKTRFEPLTPDEKHIVIDTSA